MNSFAGSISHKTYLLGSYKEQISYIILAIKTYMLPILRTKELSQIDLWFHWLFWLSNLLNLGIFHKSRKTQKPKLLIWSDILTFLILNIGYRNSLFGSRFLSYLLVWGKWYQSQPVNKWGLLKHFLNAWRPLFS